jgi:hypothetical protein
MLLVNQGTGAGGGVHEPRIGITLVIIGHGPVLAIVGAQNPLRAFRRCHGFQGGVGHLHQLVFGNQVGGGKRAVAVALGTHLLNRLDVIILVAPEVHYGFVVAVDRVVFLFRRGRSAGEKEAGTVLGEAEVAFVADHELLAKSGRVGRRQYGGGCRLAVPAVELDPGLFGGGVIAVAEER